MIDLTRSLADDTPVYPGDPPVTLHPHATHEDDGYRVTEIRFGSHAGTHVDAPAHTEPDGATIGEIPPERFAFNARLVDLRPLGEGEPIDPSHLPTDVAADRDLLVLRTGWARYWNTERYADHPFLTPEAAAWCANGGYDVALDTPSPDPRGSETLAAHHELLGAGRLVIENVASLDGLPDHFRLHAYPLPLVNGDGSPVRAVAEL